MNFTTIISYLILFSIFFSTVILTFSNPSVLIDRKSLLIVVGGSIMTAVVSFSPKLMYNLLIVFFKRMLGKKKIDYIEIIADIGELSKAKRKGKREFEKAIETMHHPFLKEGAQVLYWIEADISVDELRDLLETRAQTIFTQYMSDANIFKTIAKFPPAYGLMGTTIGMIALLQSLGGSNVSDTIGPAMAVALITTLYGLVLANLLIVPIAENLAQQTMDDITARRMIIEGLMLIQAQKPTQYIEEKVKSFLIPGKRQPNGKK